MSQPRRSLGPVIAYMLTLLGLVLGGIWLWSALQGTPSRRGGQDGAVALPQAGSTPAGGEELGATERRQLEDILRRRQAGAQR